MEIGGFGLSGSAPKMSERKPSRLSAAKTTLTKKPSVRASRGELAPATSVVAPSTVVPARHIPPVRTRKPALSNVQSKVAQARAALPFTRAKVWTEEVHFCPSSNLITENCSNDQNLFQISNFEFEIRLKTSGGSSKQVLTTLKITKKFTALLRTFIFIYDILFSTSNSSQFHVFQGFCNILYGPRSFLHVCQKNRRHPDPPHFISETRVKKNGFWMLI